ncbi:MAG TPA: HlyD family type I secretion periplasmic adaptor subunit [Geminicoccaceae bacterium]
MLRLHGSTSLTEFMPDADGLMERSHSPLAGLLILAVTGLFAGLLTWSAIAEVEQVIRAPGRVAPAGRVKVINHPNGGRIAAVHVEDGQRVVAGAPLVAFDPEMVHAEIEGLLGRHETLAAEAARLRAEAFGGAISFDADLAEARPDLVVEQTALLEERLEMQASRSEILERTIERRAGEVGTLVAEIARLKNSHALLEEQVEAVRELADRGLFPRLRMVELDRQLSDAAGELAKAGERLASARAALAEAESRRDGTEQEWRSTILAQLADVNAERKRVGEALKREQALERNLVVRAPVDGIVQDIAVSGAGQSVGSNQPLMKLVPTGGSLVIEARVANRDIGNVRPGDPARVKVQAYDFLRFGTLEGRIERIAADASADPIDGALSYEVEVVTASNRVGGGEAGYEVVPGMAVDVDLLVGERTILSYLTDRIFRLKDTAFREG